MKTNEAQSEVKVEIHTNEASPASILQCAQALKERNPYLREYAASIVRGFGFDAYIGGHHVAILKDGNTLATVTSSARDWN